ncbi:MAG: oxidoreductase [Sphingomonas bacterium]|uniref:Gfo/Idh/MocA family protein n=1 Tax=Sphingomonas bacterium TaxID=1895847 RepID=UPI002623578F|nr:Gfo/Idh/MocA family oxidoreductase [Sphingomonas bacterium]MDB5696712.1 oxidoreductase [Sphingomonas bacterium]
MTKPRIGFLGTGWIGRHRMAAMLATGMVEAVGIADPSPAMVVDALTLAPGAQVVADLDALLALGVDGVVIATPSALHAEQSVHALAAGVAVFCQKPLGRDAAEAARVVAAARQADRLLGVDFSYRHTAGMAAIAPLVRDGALGRVFAVDLTFHNAWGPDKPWFYDRAQSGGGCVMDLGVHLVDLALWVLDFPALDGRVAAQLLSGGQPLSCSSAEVEDYATAQFRLASGTVVRLACSWRLHAGREAVIEAHFHGTDGGAALRNVNGSFYEFTAERFAGTECETLTSGSDEWGGRAAAEWARRLASGERFDAAADELVRVAEVLDAIYAA